MRTFNCGPPAIETLNPKPRFRQVYGHRMTCWEEHLGRLEDVFQQPHDVNCVHRVRKLTAVNLYSRPRCPPPPPPGCRRPDAHRLSAWIRARY